MEQPCYKILYHLSFYDNQTLLVKIMGFLQLVCVQFITSISVFNAGDTFNVNIGFVAPWLHLCFTFVASVLPNKCWRDYI